MELSNSPNQFLLISSQQISETTLSKPVLFPPSAKKLQGEEEIIEGRSLKRKSSLLRTDESRGMKYRKRDDKENRDKKRVSFSSNVIHHQIPSRLSELKLIENEVDISYDIDTYEALLQELEQITQENEELSLNLENNLEQDNLNYAAVKKETTDIIINTLGINPKAPTEEDLFSILAENTELAKNLKALEDKFHRTKEETDTEMTRMKAEEYTLQESYENLKSHKHQNMKDMKAKVDTLQDSLRMYRLLTNLETEETTTGTFHCRTNKENRAVEFDIVMGEAVIYKPVGNTAQIDEFLKCELRDIEYLEIPFLFRRILNSIR